MLEKLKEHKKQIALVAGCAAACVVTGAVTYILTSRHYENSIMKLHITAEKAGLLEQLIEYQTEHGIPNLKKEHFIYQK